MAKSIPPWERAEAPSAVPPWERAQADKPGPILAEWYEEPKDTADRPKYLGDLPQQDLGRVETEPRSGRKVYVEGKGKTRAVFTDQPQAGQGGRVSAQALETAEQDTERLGKQALVGGALQGATFGFADELAGVAEAATGGSYSKTRDEQRRAFKEAEEGSPGAYQTGRLIGGGATMAVPSIGMAGAGRPLLSLKNVAIGTGMGAVAGAGESEADLTKGEYGAFAKDVGKGAGAGAAATTVLGAAGKGLKKAGQWLSTAPERAVTRADDALWDQIAYGADKATRERMAGQLGSDRSAMLEMVRSNPEFMAAVKAGDKRRAAEIVLAAQPEVEARKMATISGMESKTGKRLVGKPVADALEARAAELRATPTPENMAVADKLQKRADAIKEAWLPPPKEPKLEGEALASRLTANADSGTRERAAMNAAEFGKIAEKHGLSRDVGNIPARQEKIDEVLKTLTSKTSAIYERPKQDVFVANVTGKLKEWEDELRNAPLGGGTKDADAVAGVRARIIDWAKAAGNAETGSKTTITPKELRAEITRLQDKAFSGSYLDPNEGKAMGRELARRMRSVLDEHVAQYGSKADVKRLETLNRQISALIVFKESAEREAVKAFEGLYKAPPQAAAAARTGRAKVAELYNLIKTTEDPEAKRILTAELYRQIGPEATQRLTAVEREQTMLGNLGDVVTAAAEQKAGDAARGSRLRQIVNRTNMISAWAAKHYETMGDKANRVAVVVENLMRRGTNQAQLRAIGKAYKLTKEATEDMIRVAAPREAADYVIKPKTDEELEASQ